MKITRKDSVMTDFAMLSIGEVFEDTSGNILMKIQCIDTDGGLINAVDLETGEVTYFYGNDTVVPLKTELIVE